MPEIAEVARIVNYLRKHAAGRTLSKVKALEDTIIFGKVGTSASEVEAALTGKKILDAKQQGKYFWLEMESPPHPLFHFGMNGWMKFSNDDSAYYRPSKPEEVQWPPKFWKCMFEMEGEPPCEMAFVDARRLGRIRLVDAKAEDMRKTSPLKENGPDPVLDADVLTVKWLAEKLRSKRVPVKALLLDQANISGIGNWVGDEIMYQAKLHPEQYSNTFGDAQVKKLHDAIMYVCNTAVDLNAESDKFPEHWLMKHRWRDTAKLPNGARITFLTVGGRTSAIVPSVQKKTGAVAADISDTPEDGTTDIEEKVAANKPDMAQDIENEQETAKSETLSATKRKGRKQSAPKEAVETQAVPPSKKRKTGATVKKALKSAATSIEVPKTEEISTGRRRSARVSGM